MIKFMYISLIFFLISKTFISIVAEEPTGQKISLSVPKLSEEENESNHMPANLRCDACLAVAHQIFTAFAKFKEKKSSIKESDMLDILENTCSSGFNEYGVKQVDSVNRLSGPGLETERVMGMTQMGGRWPHRLQEMCHYYVGEVGEFDIYNVFTEGKDYLTKYLCYGKSIFGHCSQVKQSSKTEL